MFRQWITAFVSVLAIVAISACSSARPVEVADQMATSYKLPATYQDHRNQQVFFETENGRIAYTDHGEGPAVVLLHGVPTNSWMYREIITNLQADHRVISVDLLGFGSSDKPDYKGGVYAPELRAARVSSLLDHLGVSTYNVLMHDMGGLVGWELARREPSQIENLVVLNTIISKEGFNHPNFSRGDMTQTLMKAYSSRLTSQAILTKTFNDLGLKGEFELTEEECRGYVQPVREGSDPALYAFFTGIDDNLFARLETNGDALKNFNGDTLVLWGGKDDVLTTEQIPVLQSQLSIQQENIKIYPGNAHFLAEEIPETVASEVRSFLKR